MRRVAVAAIAGLAACSNAVAGPALTPVNSDWTVTIGAEVRVLPSYEGSGNTTLSLLPMFDVHRADKEGSFRSPRDGFSFGILDYGRFRAGPTTKVKFERKESSDINLRGLGDIAWTLEAGAFVEYWPVDWLRTRAELRQGIGGHHGLVSDITADLVVPVAPKLVLSGGPRLTLATAAATDPYFSITTAQSVASGLPVYTAAGGVRSYGVGAQARYVWSPTWASHMFVEYERLTGDAARSPLVVQHGTPNQIQVGIGTTYSFNIKPLW
jgi:MipA family protein